MFVDVELVFGIVELMFNVAEHKIYRGNVNNSGWFNDFS